MDFSKNNRWKITWKNHTIANGVNEDRWQHKWWISIPKILGIQHGELDLNVTTTKDTCDNQGEYACIGHGAKK
jgi:hypothetical protein